MTLEDLLHAQRGPAGDVCHFVEGRGRQRVEDERPVRLFAHVHAVQREHVKVHVEPQGRVAALDDAHRSGVRRSKRLQAEAPLRSALERAAELQDERLDHLGADAPVVAEQDAQSPRQRAHPLPNGDLGDHLLHEVHRRVRHAPAEARGAETATLAAERDQPLEAAASASDAHAAVLEDPAAQVLLDLAHHEARQPAGLLGSLAERRPVRVDRAVEHRLFATVALVTAAVCRVVKRCALSHGRTAQGRVVPARASPPRY